MRSLPGLTGFRRRRAAPLGEFAQSLEVRAEIGDLEGVGLGGGLGEHPGGKRFGVSVKKGGQARWQLLHLRPRKVPGWNGHHLAQAA